LREPLCHLSSHDGLASNGLLRKPYPISGLFTSERVAPHYCRK
jgi:hypothetical protein